MTNALLITGLVKIIFAFGIKLNAFFAYFFISLFYILTISFLNVDYVLKYFKN